MRRAATRQLHAGRRRRLAIVIAAVLQIPPQAFASTVTNCYDAGAGTLRDAVASTATGGTVDLSTLTAASPGCSTSTISLSTGEIGVFQSDLTVTGPGTSFRVAGDTVHRVFHHYGAGRLTLKNLTITYGSAPSGATTGLGGGGCVNSAYGSVYLYKARVTLCHSNTQGGGVAAAHALWMKYSSIDSNSGGNGGGAAVMGNLTMKYSTVSSNFSTGAGGGMFAILGASNKVLYSTIAQNQASGNGGGLYLIGPSGSTAAITDSTISGNQSTGAAAGALVDVGSMTLSNSTIAFNVAYTEAGVLGTWAPGLAIVGGGSTPVAKLESTIVANNYVGAAEHDLSASAVTISGNNNLVRNAPGASLPAGTITGACPLLGPLRNNGGWTATHAPMSGSPAIGQGSNSKALAVDQRGHGFARLSGTGVDIGSYEVNLADRVFATGFEGCLSL